MHHAKNPGPLEVQVVSPGRINLIGEHTDYNQGYVLPAAVEAHLKFTLRENHTRVRCRIHSDALQARWEADLDDLPENSRGWEAYLTGVLRELLQRSAPLRGFDAWIASDLPPGAGLSSSAALECGLAFGLDQLFSLGIPPMELVHLSHHAEVRYGGTECGIMDPFACVMGQKGHFIFLDCQTMEYRYIPAGLGAYQLVLIYSGVQHSLAESAYNQRRAECGEGVGILRSRFEGIRSLRDATPTHLESVRAEMPPPIYNRCRYVVEENTRVLSAVEALDRSDMPALGRLLWETHQGLQHLYEVSCPELDFLVDTAMELPGVAGARIMGGGFGGCSLNLVLAEAVPEVVARLKAAYRERFGREAAPLEVVPADGVRRVS